MNGQMNVQNCNGKFHDINKQVNCVGVFPQFALKFNCRSFFLALDLGSDCGIGEKIQYTQAGGEGLIRLWHESSWGRSSQTLGNAIPVGVVVCSPYPLT